MLGQPSGQAAPATEPPADETPTPEGIIEALLFVGHTDDSPVTAEALAEVIRDVSPAEVGGIVDRLEAAYERDGSALRIDRSESGYRLRLADGLDRVADRLRGRVRGTRLSSQALETLSVVAYRQPIAAERVEELRGESAATSLAQLVRLGLLSPVEPATDGESERFVTTDRFLRMLDLASLDQLPRVAELDD